MEHPLRAAPASRLCKAVEEGFRAVRVSRLWSKVLRPRVVMAAAEQGHRQTSRPCSMNRQHRGKRQGDRALCKS